MGGMIPISIARRIPTNYRWHCLVGRSVAGEQVLQPPSVAVAFKAQGQSEIDHVADPAGADVAGRAIGQGDRAPARYVLDAGAIVAVHHRMVEPPEQLPASPMDLWR